MAERPDSLSIVVFSGDFERVHYALVLASGTAALGTPTTLFFTMGATRALLASDAEGIPGWRNLPAAENRTGGEADDDFRAKGVAGFEDLFAACVELDVRFLVCEMGLRALGLDRDSLRTDASFEHVGVATLMNGTSTDGSLLFI